MITPSAKAVKISLLDFKTIPMRTFHMTWSAFFVCFFGWFGLAPMLKVIREDLGITTDQIVTTNMAAVASTVIMRLLIGSLCDRVGPRLAYTWLLILGAFPVMLVGLSTNYETFLLGRILIGAIGASFVITQAHTSAMFAPNCVGTANATTAGWGNLGGGVTQIVMPLLFGLALAVVSDQFLAWRLAMIVPGAAMLLAGAGYYFFTKDTPEGNLSDLNADRRDARRQAARDGFGTVIRDFRVWILFLMYGGCFGMELIFKSQAALYFSDYFAMDLKTAGLIAGLYGLMNIFTRTLGGFLSDFFGRTKGLNGRVRFLFAMLFFEGLALALFSQMTEVPFVIGAMLLFSLFVQMGAGATFSVVPFVNKKAVGLVSGIVGAGGNAGAVMAMFLFKNELTGLAWPDAFLILGIIIVVISFLAFLVRFSPEAETSAHAELKEALARRMVSASGGD